MRSLNMKAMKSLVVAAMAVAGLALAAEAHADRGGHSGGWSGGSHGGGSRGGNWSGGHRGSWGGGHRYWSGPRVGLYFGAPLLFGAYAWGYPYGYPYDYYYPRTVVVDRVIERYPEGVMEPMEPAPTTEVPRSQGGPTQAPAYMNYCESSQAYFPKVTSCPEGWKFVPAR
jgi:hypothetical protein